MYFTDIHIHALFGVDDGPKNESETFKIIDDAYAQGVRAICFTPHWCPQLFDNNHDKSTESFNSIKRYILDKKYKMCMCLGNELRYSDRAIDWLEEGLCRSLNETRYVLVDFGLDEQEKYIVNGLRNILNIGYKPILAHVERYKRLGNNIKEIDKLKSYGVQMQIDAGSIIGQFGILNKMRSKILLSNGLADIVSSDAHNMNSRPILLKKAYNVVMDKYGDSYAEKLFCGNPSEILNVQKN